MGLNLQLLGMQAVSRLARKLGADISFPANGLNIPMPPDEFRIMLDDCGKAIDSLFRQFRITWWDVYANSDIGLERLAVADEMKLADDDVVLDVGCGRGYFSAAAAKSARSVISVDLMDGTERVGWWKNFNACINELNLFGKVSGVRSDAQHLPFKGNSFSVVAAVHSIRNFQSYLSVETALREMKRVATDNGKVIIVENLPVAMNKAQESHLSMFRCKVKYASGELNYPSEQMMTEMFEKAGFREITIKRINYEWSAAPPLFCINEYLASLKESEREKAKEEYDEAANMIKKWGETSPPALFAAGTK